MSHFSLLVTAQDKAELENTMVRFLETGMRGEDEEMKLADDGLLHLEFVVKAKFDELEKHAQEIMDKISSEDDYYEKYKEFMKEKDYAQMFNDWNGLVLDEKTGNYGYWHNPEAHWDWYSIGGRWTGKLKLKKSKRHKQYAKDGIVGNGTPGLMTELNRDSNYCDFAPAHMIDWAGIKEDQLNSELDAFDKIMEIRDKYQRLRREKEFDISELEDAPELLKSWKNWNDSEFLRELFPDVLDFFYVEYLMSRTNDETDLLFMDYGYFNSFMCTREQYIKQHKADALTFAFIDLDGNWVEREHMGMWGISWKEDKHEELDYDDVFWKFLESIPDDMTVFFIDCHI